MMRISLAIVLLLLAKHQQHGVEASSRSVESAYDTNKSVFSPQGRLVQLDYVEVRDALCVMRSIVVVRILHLILGHDLRLLYNLDCLLYLDSNGHLAHCISSALLLLVLHTPDKW